MHAITEAFGVYRDIDVPPRKQEKLQLPANTNAHATTLRFSFPPGKNSTTLTAHLMDGVGMSAQVNRAIKRREAVDTPEVPGQRAYIHQRKASGVPIRRVSHW